MPLFKIFGGAFILTALVFLIITRYVFNQVGYLYLIIAVLAGVLAGTALVFSAKRKTNKKV
jgi:hypothetical protein